MRTLLALAIVTGLGLGDASDAAPSPVAAQPAAPVAIDAAFARDAAAAGVVFEGRVVEIGPAPGFWSGFAVAYQTVTYQVTKIHSDPERRLRVGSRAAVRHWIVAGSETADRTPRLRPDLVHVGATLIVLADFTASDKQWTGIDERHGIVAADAAHRAALNKGR